MLFFIILANLRSAPLYNDSTTRPPLSAAARPAAARWCRRLHCTASSSTRSLPFAENRNAIFICGLSTSDNLWRCQMSRCELVSCRRRGGGARGLLVGEHARGGARVEARVPRSAGRARHREGELGRSARKEGWPPAEPARCRNGATAAPSWFSSAAPRWTRAQSPRRWTRASPASPHWLSMPASQVPRV